MARVVWPRPIQGKLSTFKSAHFSPQESRNYIGDWIKEVERTLLSGVVSRWYTEESGAYRDVSRMVVRGFRVYFERVDDDMVVLAVKFPGEP